MRATAILLLSLFLLLSFCACDSYTAPADPLFYESKPFTVSASGTVGDQPIAFQLTKREGNDFELCLTEPSNWQNLSVLIPHNFEESGITLCYDGMRIPLSQGRLPASLFAIVKLFSFAQSEVSACRLVKDTSDTEISFSCTDGTATLILASESGYPKSAQAQLYGISLSLSFDSFHAHFSEGGDA